MSVGGGEGADNMPMSLGKGVVENVVFVPATVLHEVTCKQKNSEIDLFSPYAATVSSDSPAV